MGGSLSFKKINYAGCWHCPVISKNGVRKIASPRPACVTTWIYSVFINEMKRKKFSLMRLNLLLSRFLRFYS